jgi:hypothetical protein
MPDYKVGKNILVIMCLVRKCQLQGKRNAVNGTLWTDSN